MELIAKTVFTLTTALSFKGAGVALFVLGIAIGSFLNVVAIRYKGRGKIFDFTRNGGRSHCPHCHATLSWYELIPLLSFMLQTGKCRYCGHSLSWQYPLVELLTGLLFLLPLYLYNAYNISLRVFLGESVGEWYFIIALWLVAGIAMILLSVIDWKLRIIPNQINLFIAFIGVAMTYLNPGSFLGNYTSILFPVHNPWQNHIMASMVGAIFFGSIILVSRGRAMGVGDLKLIVAIGLLVGWPDIIFVIAASCIAGSIWGMYLIAREMGSLKTTVPFGPFIVIGFFLAFLFSHDFLSWYVTFIR